MPHAHSRGLPSIYTALPILPAISSHYDPHTATVSERETTAQLARLLDQGSANYVLQHALVTHAQREEQRRRNRERYDAPRDSSGSESPRRKRSRRTRWSSVAEGGDDEKTESEFRSRARSTGPRRSAKSFQAPPPRLATELPPLDVPDHFPSGSLLSCVHLHASHLYASTHSLLPPLTSEAPLLPPHLLTHFNHVSASLNAHEQRLLERPGLSLKQLNEVRDNRLGKMGTGARKRVWTNCEKKFDPSALVALGMLTKLLVEDSLKPPTIEISQHGSPRTPLSPASQGVERRAPDFDSGTGGSVTPEDEYGADRFGCEQS